MLSPEVRVSMSHASAGPDSPHGVVKLPNERRAGWRVQDHWSRVKAEGDDVPSLADLDLGRNAELEDVSFLLREDEMVELSVFVLCGDAVRMAFPDNPVGLTLGEAIPREIIRKIKQAIQHARTESRPVACEGRLSPPERVRNSVSLGLHAGTLDEIDAGRRRLHLRHLRSAGFLRRGHLRAVPLHRARQRSAKPCNLPSRGRRRREMREPCGNPRAGPYRPC